MTKAVTTRRGRGRRGRRRRRRRNRKGSKESSERQAEKKKEKKEDEDKKEEYKKEEDKRHETTTRIFKAKSATAIRTRGSWTSRSSLLLLQATSNPVFTLCRNSTTR